MLFYSDFTTKVISPAKDILELLKKQPKAVVLVATLTRDRHLALARDAKISLHTKETNTTIVVATASAENMDAALTLREVADVPGLNA